VKTESFDFATILKSEIESRIIMSDTENDEIALSEVALSEYACQLFEESDYLFQFEVARFCKTLSGGLAKCNGYSFDSEQGILWLFVVDFDANWSETGGLNAQQVKQRSNELIRFCSSLDNDLSLEPASGEYELSNAILKMLAGDDVKSIRAVVISNRAFSGRKVPQNVKLKSFGQTRSLTIEIVDLRRLALCALSTDDREDVLVEFEEGDQVRAVCTLENKVALAFLPGLRIAELYRTYGARILEGNVRSYLQGKGKVNRGILDSLEKEPENFFSYNNGLTIVCKDFVISKDGYLEKILEPQIVNGGQTTASLWKAMEENQDLELVLVQAKIVKVSEGSDHLLLSKISRYSNSQNKISQADLFANDEFLVELEKASKRFLCRNAGTFTYFERSRGAYLSDLMKLTLKGKSDFEKKFPKKEKFSKEDFALAYNCWGQKPHFASRGGQKNFHEFSRTALEKRVTDFESQEYRKQVGKLILYRLVKSGVHKIKTIAAYRNNVVAYVVSVLSGTGMVDEQDLSDIYDDRILPIESHELESVIRKVYTLMKNQVGNLNATEVFKKDSCWRSISNEFGILEKSERVFIRDLPLSDLSELQQWVLSNDIGDNFDKGVLSTIVGYAASAWQMSGLESKPSEKQIARFMKLYNEFQISKGFSQSTG
jgi:hypothetical protein